MPIFGWTPPDLSISPDEIFGWKPPDLSPNSGDWWRIATPWAVVPLDKPNNGGMESDKFNPAKVAQNLSEIDPMFWLKIALGYLVITKVGKF